MARPEFTVSPVVGGHTEKTGRVVFSIVAPTCILLTFLFF